MRCSRFILAVLCLLAFSTPAAHASQTVNDGVLDLRGQSLDKPIVAQGSWEFYWQQLLTPQTIDSEIQTKSLIKVPGLWSQDPAHYSVLGYGTYRLKVRLDQPRPLAIAFPPAIWSSSKIFVDGEEIAAFGVVGTSAETSSGGLNRKIYSLNPKSASFDIIIQAANFEIFLCGLIKPISIGTLDAIEAMRGRSLAMDLFVMGAIFIMGLYHICLFLLRTEDGSTLWFGVFCLGVMTYLGASTEGLLLMLIPDIDLTLLLRIFNIAWIGAVAAFAWFTRHVFPRAFSRNVARLTSAVAVAYFVLIATTSHRLFVGVVNYFHAVTLLLLVYCIKTIVQSMRQKAEGAGIFLGGILVITFTTVNDVLAVRQIIVSPVLAGFGLMGFILFQSTLLALRFSKAFARVKTSEQEIRGLSDDLKQQNQKIVALNSNLERLVDEKTRDIRTMMEHIPLGVFMITSERRIHKDRSRRLVDIFPGQNPDTMEATDFLFAGSTLGSDVRQQAVACIQGALGENALNFETNAHLLPLELVHQNASDPRFFDLTWNVIENSAGNVDKMLVTLRDVTDLRSLQERSRDQQEELEFIGEILRVPSPRFLRFLRSCREFIKENEKLIRSQAIENKNLEVLKLLFVNMHTVKGAARSLYLKKMSQVFHEVEQYYAHLQAHASARWDVGKMAADLDEAKKIVDLYETIAREKLGRSSEQGNTVEFPIEDIRTSYRQLQQNTLGSALSEGLHHVIEHILGIFHARIFKDADAIFQEILGVLPVLAKDLHKEIPEVQLETKGILLSQQADELFRNIFVHLLRNTMDHGIETGAERLQVGKHAKGRVSITMAKHQDRLRLSYTDDGRGLPLDRIREMGLARGLITPADIQDRHKIAELIFDSGLSTANKVTDISGRGVGMDAVKRFIEQAAGTIHIELSRTTDPAASHSGFAFQIDLPFALFDSHQHEGWPVLQAAT